MAEEKYKVTVRKTQKVNPFMAPEQTEQVDKLRQNTNAAGKIVAEKTKNEPPKEKPPVNKDIEDAKKILARARQEEAGVKVIEKPRGSQANHHVTTGKNTTKPARGGFAGGGFGVGLMPGEQIK